MRNILLLIALCALVCLVQSFDLQSFAKSFSSDNGIFYPVTTNSTECSSKGDCLGEGDDSCVKVNCSLADGNCCAAGLFCYGNVSTNATCVSNNIGDWCTTTVPCFGTYGSVPGGNLPADYSYSCVDSECAVTYMPGDYCEADSDCNTNSCDTDNNVCLGLGFNVSCPDSSHCAYGLTCNSNKTSPSYNRCTPLAAEGDSCQADTDCYPGYACISGNCTEAFSAAQGAKCGSDIACDTDSVCWNGQCVEGTEFDSSSCDSNSDCDSNSVCMCSEITGEQFCFPVLVSNYTNSREALSNVYECVRENNCTNFGMAPNSCIMQNCDSDADDTYDTECDIADDAAGDCYYNDSCGGFPVWAIIVIVIVAVVLVLVIVVVVVMAMRKRRQYDTIA